jgi:hypothetical protein
MLKGSTLVTDRSSTGGVSLIDYDGDGDGLQDILVGSWPNAPGPNEENVVLLNRSAGGNWLGIELEGTESNAAGIGARIVVTAGEGEALIVQTREVQAHTGWRSQNNLVQHFGLGSYDDVSVVVSWPSGNTSQRPVVAANQRIVIVEGS